MEFSAFLRRIGLASQKELAAKLGTSDSNVSKWVAGRGYPSFELVAKLLLLGMSIEELFGKEVADKVKVFIVSSNNSNFFYDLPEFRKSVEMVLKDHSAGNDYR